MRWQPRFYHIESVAPTDRSVSYAELRFDCVFSPQIITVTASSLARSILLSTNLFYGPETHRARFWILAPSGSTRLMHAAVLPMGEVVQMCVYWKKPRKPSWFYKLLNRQVPLALVDVFGHAEVMNDQSRSVQP